MDPLSLSASIIAVLQLSSIVLGYLNDVKDASKDRAKCAIEASSLHSLLFNLRFRLEEGNLTEAWYTSVRALGVENGPLDQFKQALEELQARMTSGSKLRRVGHVLMWNLSKDEVYSILNRMERLKTLVHIALEMDHFKLSQAIKQSSDMINSNTEAIMNDTSFVRTRIPTLELGVDEIQKKQNRALDEELFEWLSPSNYPAQLSDFIRRRQADTGTWFLEAPEFAKWLNGPKETLFCPGIPGAGKTMIATIAVSHLLTIVQDEKIGLAYVYCNYKQQVEENTTSLLAAVLKQLVQARPSLAEPVQRLHIQHLIRRTKPSLEDIYETLKSVLVNYSSIYIIVDALDESGDRREFLSRVRSLQSLFDLRLMATSRFVGDVLKEFKDVPKLEVRATDQDVRRYIGGQIHRLPNCVQRSAELQTLVQDKITEAVDGMFLLARLYTDSLQDKGTKKAIKLAVERFSKSPNGSKALTRTYDDAYDEAMQRIDSQLPGRRELGRKVLSWITQAKRQLTTAELCHALAVEADEEDLDPDNIPDVEDLVSACAGLATVDQDSDVIRLVHYTTQEYFERIFESRKPHAQLEIASTCLTYLSFNTFRDDNGEQFQEKLKRYPFLNYAAEHWGQHISMVQKELCELSFLFLKSPNAVFCAANAMSTRNPIMYPVGKTGLHLTSWFGLQFLTRQLISKCNDERCDDQSFIDPLDAMCITPLFIAAERGHETIVELLYDGGADINSSQFVGTPLEAASFGGHLRVVMFLLDRGAILNSSGGIVYGNGLITASYLGHKHIVQLLLARGVNPDLQDPTHLTALEAASEFGHWEIVELLLEYGADVTIRNFTPLQRASEMGHLQVIKVLLGNRRYSAQYGPQYENALARAASHGYHEIVQLLLDSSVANYTSQGKNQFDNVLHAAAYYGYKPAVELALSKGADIDEVSPNFGSALGAASISGHVEILKLLLERGASCNNPHYDGVTVCTTCLQAAAYNNHEEVIKVLLHCGTDVNAQGDYFQGTALQAASYNGNERIVKLLLDAGADINDRSGWNNRSPLEVASEFGHVQVVELLLSMQPMVTGVSVLLACAHGHKQIVDILLSSGAKLSDYAMSLALQTGHTDVVQFLLDKGAKISDNAFSMASENGHKEVIQLLLQSGIAPSAEALRVAVNNGHLEIVELFHGRVR